jgi:hypothetical protein
VFNIDNLRVEKDEVTPELVADEIAI